MKIQRIGKTISVVLLLGVFIYSTAVRELHYAFSAKYHTTSHTDQCDHHIHPTDKEDDCSICHVDVNHFYDNEEVVYSFSRTFLPRPEAEAVPAIFHSLVYDTPTLRGPPTIS